MAKRKPREEEEGQAKAVKAAIAGACKQLLKAKEALPPATVDKERRTDVMGRFEKQGLLAVQVLNQIYKPFVGNDPDVSPLDVAGRTVYAAFHDLEPRTAAERMLVEQLVVTHAQLLNVQRMAFRAEQYDRIEQLLNVASRLQADYRKTLMALKEWRAPAKNFIVAQQANFAQQQVVNQNPNFIAPPNELGTNNA